MCLDNEMIRFETENRIRNLVWTVSGDYSLKVEPDVDLFFRSANRGLYNAVCQGAFFRDYDHKALSMYLLKKLYYMADEDALSRIVKLCMDAAAGSRIVTERKGAGVLRIKAMEDFLEEEFAARCRSLLGQLELMWYAMALGRKPYGDDRMMGLIRGLLAIESTDDVIRLADRIYNTLADPQFEKKHGDLEMVLAVTLEELAEADFDWQDFLAEEAETFDDRASDSQVDNDNSQNTVDRRDQSTKAIQVDEESRKKAYAYMELNYGRSYMSSMEQRRLSLTLCQGVHEGCSLFFSEGILANTVRKNYQSEYVRRQKEFNITERKRCRTMANRNIQQLAQIMNQALIRRSEIERVKSVCGMISAQELWKPGRTVDHKLFLREIRQNNSEFVVDILMDGSGSQHDRRGAVAVQGYIISEALSIAGIPHRVQSFCTCWDYTILQRFREYDDPRSANERIMEFSTSANNRDGLAIKAVVHQLLKRTEENKILIVLSDGRPNDRIVNRSVSRTPTPYVGDFAVFDTAEEVRRARRAGVAVLGVFAGKEIDLEAEKRIFGRDFAYIRDIRNFSHVVGRYLKRQLDSVE